MIYDCFMFFNELDILEIRLNVLNEVVDKFVLVESPFTLSGDQKQLYYQENRERYIQFSDKIIHIISAYPPPEYKRIDSNGQDWSLQLYQRDAIMRGLQNCHDDDVVLISDVDEIPNPKKILLCKDMPGIKILDQKMMYYYVNFQRWDTSVWGISTRMGHYKDLLNPGQDLPDTIRHLFSRKGMPTYFRYCQGTHIADGGWHFSYCGGIDSILVKRRSITTRHMNTAENMTPESIRRAIQRGRDIYGRPHFFKIVPIDASFPAYLRDNLHKYPHLVLSRKGVEKYIGALWHCINLCEFCYLRTRDFCYTLLRAGKRTVKSILRPMGMFKEC